MLKVEVIIGEASRCCFKSVSVKNVARKVYIFTVVVVVVFLRSKQSI